MISGHVYKFRGSVTMYYLRAESQGLHKRRKYDHEIQLYLGHSILHIYLRSGGGPWGAGERVSSRLCTELGD